MDVSFVLKVAILGFLSLFIVSCEAEIPSDEKYNLNCEPAPHLVYVKPKLSYYEFPVGAAQGIRVIGKKIYIYGDGETGIIRELEMRFDPTGWLRHFSEDGMRSIVWKKNWLAHFTVKGEDLISHPVGIAYQPNYPTFIGNSDGFIFQIDWETFKRDKNLDRAFIHKIFDTETPENFKGTRPEYVEVKGRWYVATCDYDNPQKGYSELRLMNPQKLMNAKETRDPEVIEYRIPVARFVQTLFWHSQKKQLVLVQNITRKARGWRLTFIDLSEDIEHHSGLDEAVITTVCFPYTTELEGYTILKDEKELFLTAGGELFAGFKAAYIH